MQNLRGILVDKSVQLTAGRIKALLAIRDKKKPHANATKFCEKAGWVQCYLERVGTSTADDGSPVALFEKVYTLTEDGEDLVNLIVTNQHPDYDYIEEDK